MKEMTVFLFEQIMIFAETVGKKTQFTSPVYTYKAHIQVGKVHTRKNCLSEKIRNNRSFLKGVTKKGTFENR